MAQTDYNQFFKSINTIFDKNRYSLDNNVLDSYSSDESFSNARKPNLVIWPYNADEVQKIIQLANKFLIPILPVSSSLKKRENGDTIPKKENTVIIDLSKMNKIIRVDKKNRVCMIEPGVTFGQLIPELEKNGLKPLIPLHPRSNKSVLASVLERNPIMLTKYHWDPMDPLICTEVVFGTGDIFRTGSAAGPGTLEEQWEVGQAQKNPMGPTQFSIARTIQGAQGCMGIVTWASIKCEFLPTKQSTLFIRNKNDEKIDIMIDFLQKYLLKYRLGDETFITNSIAFSSLIHENSEDIKEFASNLGSKWVLVDILSGRGKFDNDKILYLQKDIEDYIKEYSLNLDYELPKLDSSHFIKNLKDCSEEAWVNRLKGNCQKIFFITPLTKVSSFITLVSDYLNENYVQISDLGIYIQPLMHGCNCHLEFQLYYDSNIDSEKEMIKEAYNKISELLVKNGAFFSRPYGDWASFTFQNYDEMGIEMYHRVKRIFDPNNIMNPGVLCFNDEFGFKEGTK